MIQRKIDQLDEADRRLLVAASVQGSEFDAAVVARALGLDAADVEERLERLERVHGFVRLAGRARVPRPDADAALRLRARAVPECPVRLAAADAAGGVEPRRWPRRCWAIHGEKSAAVAAELALLLEAAREFARAADYFLLAAQNAARVFANQEAVVLGAAGLELLETLPDTPELRRKELALQITLGPPLMATMGWTAPEVERTYTRARTSCAGRWARRRISSRRCGDCGSSI